MRSWRQVSMAALLFMLPLAASAQWYSGGTLHKARGSQWVVATEANRLATAADFAGVALGEEAVQRLGSMNKLKPYAINIKACVDETFSDSSLRGMSVSEVASACIILLGYY